MADPRDPKDPNHPQPPVTPAPTDLSQQFMVEEEIEEHRDKGVYTDSSDIQVGHGKVPKFLKFVYAALAFWGLYYALAASPINDRHEASPTAAPTAEAGADVFSASCAGCHNVTAERKIGPGLLGVHERLGDQGLDDVLHKGRPDKGMPAPPSLNLNESQIQSLKLYLTSLKK
ncbi:c-type cytochrome [Tumebacillus permanentifrigoris]|uniref:Cytochrome c553 n=1 Tax=Tumebacillus permanentifrigoris TaxID=378543 RepID=A0A316DCK3_9BACL|nr:cytochrome c [Tumebacillus permanentifrigoris]PWK15887.1 cytochrome c553 [Tumebacillus permanentifrigoris]